jgi:hypothetical protein
MNICTTNEIMLISLEEARGEAERANSLVGRMGGEASAGRGRDAEHQHKLAPLRRPAALGDRRARPTRKPTFDMSVFSAKADLPFTLRPNPFAAHLRFETTGEVP